METQIKVCTLSHVFMAHRPRLTVMIFFGLALGVFTWAANADTWTGAGQISAIQDRDWIIPGNWFNNAVPVGEIDRFKLTGDGTIALFGNQSAGGLIFEDFTDTRLYPDVLGPAPLALVNEPGGGGVPPKIRSGETLRDTYGVDYYTTGPQLAVDLQLNAAPRFEIGNLGAGTVADKSAMLVSGVMTSIAGNTITYNGYGTGTSLWFTQKSTLAGITVNVNAVGAGGGGYILNLADNGRIDQATINLNASQCYLGLHDTQNGPAAVQDTINSYAADIFADRSYLQNDLNNLVNVLQTINGTVQIRQNNAKFGGTGTFGRTNNGYYLRVATLKFTETSTVDVNNGNLTEDRGGSRYISGANRLQEAHNYTYVTNLNAVAQPLTKRGSGVLAIERVNGAGLWPKAPTVQAGVLRLGTQAVAHSLQPADWITVAPDGGVGIAWDSTINLRAAAPLPLKIIPSANIIGQSGAIDPDLWNFLFTTANPLIDPNVNPLAGNLTYLRIGSSMGGDASFDTQPQAAKHASIAFMNNQGLVSQIIPYVIGPNNCNIYYFGGGGGTLRVNAQLGNYQQRTTMFEMGTTGTLLPGAWRLIPAAIPSRKRTLTRAGRKFPPARCN